MSVEVGLHRCFLSWKVAPEVETKGENVSSLLIPQCLNLYSLWLHLPQTVCLSLFSLSLPPSPPPSLPPSLSPFLPCPTLLQLGCGLPPTSNTKDSAEKTPPPAPKGDRNTEKLKEWLEFEPDTTKDQDMDDLGTLSDYEFGKYRVHHDD